MLEQLEIFQCLDESAKGGSSLSLSGSLAKIYQMLEKGEVLKAQEVACSLKLYGLLGNSDPSILSLKTSKDCLQINKDRTLQDVCKKLPTLGIMAANGNCLIQSGFYPKIESGYILSDILEDTVNQKYFLSPERTAKIQECLRNRI